MVLVLGRLGNIQKKSDYFKLASFEKHYLGYVLENSLYLQSEKLLELKIEKIPYYAAELQYNMSILHSSHSQVLINLLNKSKHS